MKTKFYNLTSYFLRAIFSDLFVFRHFSYFPVGIKLGGVQNGIFIRPLIRFCAPSFFKISPRPDKLTIFKFRFAFGLKSCVFRIKIKIKFAAASNHVTLVARTRNNLRIWRENDNFSREIYFDINISWFY